MSLHNTSNVSVAGTTDTPIEVGFVAGVVIGIAAPVVAMCLGQSQYQAFDLSFNFIKTSYVSGFSVFGLWGVSSERLQANKFVTIPVAATVSLCAGMFVSSALFFFADATKIVSQHLYENYLRAPEKHSSLEGASRPNLSIRDGKVYIPALTQLKAG